MTLVFGVFLLTLLVIVAVAIVRSTNLFAAVMLSGIFSLLMAVNFFLLDAADVALTEAAVGAGVATVLFLSALALTAEHEQVRPGGAALQWLPLVVAFATGGLLIYATFQNPVIGDPNAPVHQHVAPWYLENTPELIDIPNVVTAVLGSFRGFDTLGEVFVVFTAGIGVLSILGLRHTLVEMTSAEIDARQRSLRDHLIPRVVGRGMVPFILLFALYVQFHGEYSPGGGFQAGAIAAAAIILYSLLEGDDRGRALVPEWLLQIMMASGALLFGGVGVVCMLLGGSFLDYSVLAEVPSEGQHLGLLLIELGVGITVSGVLLTVFHAFARRASR
ncbi:MAG: cation:proton antiporter [Gammaproteobacteria bacterium]|nr:cation:proton antiporter [Gammaproteobacteria bacterium]